MDDLTVRVPLKFAHRCHRVFVKDGEAQIIRLAPPPQRSGKMYFLGRVVLLVEPADTLKRLSQTENIGSGWAWLQISESPQYLQFTSIPYSYYCLKELG